MGELFFCSKLEENRFSMVDRRKRKTNRVFVKSEKIEPPAFQLQMAQDGLNEFYDANPHFLKRITKEEKIKEVIDKSIEGWVCAPKDFIKRVEALTKWNCKHIVSRADYKSNYYNEKMVKELKDTEKLEKSLYQAGEGQDLKKFLATAERKDWVQREAYYRKEYELNDSSDWPLLQQILVEEILQNRLAKRKLLTEEDMDTQLNESYKRMITAQKALGVTREQRQGMGTNSEGSISQLAAQFDEKKRLIAKQMEKDALEEEIEQMRKQRREGIQVLRQMGFDEMATDLARAEDEEHISLEEIEKAHQDKVRQHLESEEPVEQEQPENKDEEGPPIASS